MVFKTKNSHGAQRTSGGLQPISVGLEPRLAALESRASEALTLADAIRAALPAEEKTHVLSASYREDTLHISVDSSVWCSRLRYREQELRAGLTAAGAKPFTNLKVRVGKPA